MDTVAKICLTAIAVAAIIAVVVIGSNAPVSARLIDVVLVCAAGVSGMAAQSLTSKKGSSVPADTATSETQDVI